MATLTFSDNINNKLLEFKTEDFFNQEVIRPLLDLIEVEIPPPTPLVLIIPKILEMVISFLKSMGKGGGGSLSDLLASIMGGMDLPYELSNLLLLEDIYCDLRDFDFKFNFSLSILDIFSLAMLLRISLCDEDITVAINDIYIMLIGNSNIPNVGVEVTNLITSVRNFATNPTEAIVQDEIAIKEAELMELVFDNADLSALLDLIALLEINRTALMELLFDIVANGNFDISPSGYDTPLYGSPNDFNNESNENIKEELEPDPNNFIYRGYVPKWDIGVPQRIRYNGEPIEDLSSLIKKVEEIDNDLESYKVTRDGLIDGLGQNVKDVNDELESKRDKLNRLKSSKILVKDNIDKTLLSIKGTLDNINYELLNVVDKALGIIAEDDSLDDVKAINAWNLIIEDATKTPLKELLEEKGVNLTRYLLTRFKGRVPVFDVRDSNDRVIYNANLLLKNNDDVQLPIVENEGFVGGLTYIKSPGVYNVEEIVEPIETLPKDTSDVKVLPTINKLTLSGDNQLKKFLDYKDAYDIKGIPLSDKLSKTYGKQLQSNIKSKLLDIHPLSEHTLTDNELLRLL